ncbi:MAG TPA: carbon-nitrogen hydrolase family protein [Acidimicrobiia bacterium]|nr:carbon-nitrogen hydrolase family protein [Acidimicrobiia bacterium]
MPEPATSPPRDLVVALVQIPARQAWADDTAVEANTKTARSLYEMHADESDLVVFPELALTGYIPLKGYDQRRKRILSQAAAEAAGSSLPELLEATKDKRAVMVVGLMEPAAMRHEFYNSVVVLDDGRIAAVYRKIHLPVEENHYFTPGDEVVLAETRAGLIAPMICYDLLFPEVTRIAALGGAEVIVTVSNWLDIAHLRRLGEVLPAARALESHAHVLFVNGVGDLEARGHRFSLYGGSRAVTATGEVVAETDGSEGVLVATLPGADLDAASAVFPVMRDRRPEVYQPLIAPASAFAMLNVDPADD